MTTENELCLPLPSLWGNKKRPHTACEWEYFRKPELLEIYSSQVYGRTPEGGGVLDVEETSRDETAFGGLATRSQFKITLGGPLGTKTAMLLLYTPNTASRSTPTPTFVGLNFLGNHATSNDPEIVLSPGFVNEGVWDKSAAARGSDACCWPVSIPLERGYAVATMHYAELEPDWRGYAAAGVRGLFNSAEELASPAPDTWGAIGAWAWGLSRILDVLAQRPEIDASAVTVFGHSRLGKTALWAAAQDPRFAAVISNNSGCCGAALFRHDTGETIAGITHHFPHWFCKQLTSYADDALKTLPIDQHQLLGLIAPRPIHVTSSTQDAYRREYVTTLYASPAMELYNRHGPLAHESVNGGEDLDWKLAAQIPTPQPGMRVGKHLSFSLREGPHDLLAEDWRHFVAFADENLLRKAPSLRA